MNVELTEIVWWESAITEHQVHTLSKLSSKSNVKLTTYVQVLGNSERKKQGWFESDLSLINAKLISSSPVSFIANALRKKHNCKHIFAGPFDSFWITFALFYSLLLNNRTYVLTEPYSPIAAELLGNGGYVKSWILKKIRPLKYRFLWLLLRNNINGIFAISPLAIKQLLLFGVRKEKIYPFAYFVPLKVPKLNSKVFKRDQVEKKLLKLVFVGTLNYTKGIDLAIRAVNKALKKRINVVLDVYGPCQDVNTYKWSTCIKYKGVIPFGTAQLKIVEYDLLILPSRYDGWGVVINESILAGVPVLCSKQAGASGLIKKWNCGEIYDSDNEGELTELLIQIFNEKKIKLNEYCDAISKVNSYILPECGAEYIVQSLRDSNLNKINLSNEWYECSETN